MRGRTFSCNLLLYPVCKLYGILSLNIKIVVNYRLVTGKMMRTEIVDVYNLHRELEFNHLVQKVNKIKSSNKSKISRELKAHHAINPK